MDEKGNILKISGKFDENEIEFIDDSPGPKSMILIRETFKVNGHWHAVISQNNKLGVISETGAELETVPFAFNNLQLVKKYKGKGQWLIYTDSLRQKGFIHTSGEKRFAGQFDRFHKLNANYPFMLATNDEEQAVIDLRKIKFAVKPFKGTIKQLDIAWQRNICSWEIPEGMKRSVRYF